MNHNTTHVEELINNCPHLDQVHYENKSVLINEYILKNKPCVITGLAEDWQTHRWTLDFFKANYGSMTIKTRRRHFDTSRKEEQQVLMTEYIDYVKENENQPEPIPFYNNTDFHPPKELVRDYQLPDFLRCDFNNFKEIKDFPTLSWIYIAPTNSITALHTDIGNSAAWNLVISGSKFWVFYPEDQVKFLSYGQVNPFNPDLKTHPKFAESKPFVYVQKPGEIIFTPGGMWHAVLNIKMGVSLTENFINQYDAKVVKEFCVDNDITIPGLN